MAARFARRQFIWPASIALSAIVGGYIAGPQIRPPSSLAERLRPKPVEPGPDSLFVDILYLERPFGDHDLNHALWASADENLLTFDRRQPLDQNGFRVGILGGQLPTILKTLFEEDELKVERGQHLQAQSGVATEIQTGGEHPAWPDVKEAKGNLTLQNAIGVLRTTAVILSNGQVQLSVTPEIQHGDPRRLFVPNVEPSSQLDWTIKVGRLTHALDELRFAAVLRSQQYLILSCRTDNPESHGARFFSYTQNGRTLQRVILIRAEASDRAVAARRSQAGLDN